MDNSEGRMHVLPPKDPDGWKRNFNSFLLVGQSTILVLAILSWFVWGGATYTEITKQQKTNTESISTLTNSLSALASRFDSSSSELMELRRWRDALENTIKDRRGEIEGSIRAVATHAEANDARIDKLESETARISDKLSATDAKLNESLVNIREMQKTLNDQSVSIEVIRAWVEEQKRDARSPRDSLK